MGPSASFRPTGTGELQIEPFVRRRTHQMAASDTSSRPSWRYRVLTHLHSLRFNALVVTSVATSARFSTGPGQVGVVEIPDRPGQRPARDAVVTDSGSLVTNLPPSKQVSDRDGTR
jgi:hypothetical protein